MMNWRRGIAEVALRFIGITLALLFDNWNEARKDRALEEQLFAALRGYTRRILLTERWSHRALTQSSIGKP